MRAGKHQSRTRVQRAAKAPVSGIEGCTRRSGRRAALGYAIAQLPWGVYQ